MQEEWKAASTSSHLSCKICAGEQAAKGRHAVDKTLLYTCAGAGCSSEERQLRWPESHFLSADLRHAVWQGVNAQCARCIVTANAEATDIFTCNACNSVKYITEYSTIYCRQFL